VNTGETGYTYDTVTYTITDTVSEEDGQLKVSRVVTNEQNKQVTSLTFINKYSSGGGVTGPKTGDDSNTDLYIILLIAGGIFAAGGTVFMMAGRIRKGAAKDGIFIFPVVLLAVCVMVYAGVNLLETQQIYMEGDAAYEDLNGRVRKNIDTPEQTPGPGIEPAEKPRVYIPKLGIDFNELTEINKDAAAWLYSPDTVIDYPVMKADDYDYYLHHLPDGKRNANGTLFIDYNCAADFSGQLTVIYGHHMKSGRMFGSLNGYKDQKYYDKHPFMYLYTPQKNYRIDLIYGCVIGAGEWRNRAFMYEVNVRELMSYAEHNTTFVSDAGYEEGDRIVAMSTCSYEFDHARYVVLGILREEY
jgi:sortase B